MLDLANICIVSFIYYLPFRNHGVMDNEDIQITSMNKRPGRPA